MITEAQYADLFSVCCKLRKLLTASLTTAKQ